MIIAGVGMGTDKAQTAFELARAAQAVGLVVTRMEPRRCHDGTEFDIALYQPDGKLWAEGNHESTDMVGDHIAGYAARQSTAPAPAVTATATATAGVERSPLLGELVPALNRVSAENGSHTPDFVLAKFLSGCLRAFDAATLAREGWYGVALRPGQGRQVARAEMVAALQRVAGRALAEARAGAPAVMVARCVKVEVEHLVAGHTGDPVGCVSCLEAVDVEG